MTLRPLRHALDDPRLPAPARAFGSGVGSSGQDETPPTDPKQGPARRA